MKKAKLYLLSIALLGLGLALVIGVAELFLRSAILRDASESRDHVEETDYMPVKLRSNYGGVLFGVRFQTNAYGFRDEPEFPKAREDGVFRIISVGDSIGFGVGIPPETHYTKVLQRHLNSNQSSQRFHVVNAAGQGYSPSSYYVYLKNEGLDLNPDMVIADMEMCTVITNEALLHWVVDPNRPEGPAAIRGGRYLVSWDGKLLATYSMGGYFFEKSYLYTDLLRRFLNLAFRLFPTEPFARRSSQGVSYYDLGFDQYLLNSERLQTGWEKTFKVVRAMQTMLEEKGIPFLLLIMPSRHMFQDAAPAWRDYATDLMERGVGRAREMGINFLEFSEPMARSVAAGGPDRFYMDFAHMTEEGNRVVGDVLFEHLGPQLLTEIETPEQAANQP